MCNNCFLVEYENFPTENEWLKFDFELTKKLSSKKMNTKNLKVMEFEIKMTANIFMNANLVIKFGN